MKIGIVTVYYTENCGSVLQATELSDKLKKMVSMQVRDKDMIQTRKLQM